MSRSPAHDSAHLHVSGRALYADDIPLPPETLHAAFGLSSIAHGRVLECDLAPVLSAAGAVAIAGAADVPGENNYGGHMHDDPIFATDLVEYAGQPLFAVAATSHGAARRAARAARIAYAALPAILDVRAALAAESYVLPSVELVRGNPVEMIERAPRRLQGSVALGGQDHFYLEGQIAIAVPQEDGGMLIHSSTQHPSEVQQIVAQALARPAHAIVVQCRRMGGGFGGKETQPALIAAAAAVLARKTQRPVKLRLDRDADMLATGKRHDFIADYDVGFESDGRITALRVMLASRCGYSADLSGPVNDRAVMHLDNAYFLEHVAIVSHRCKTHTVSNTAFRGFGGPQGMIVIEQILDEVARTLRLDPLAVRRANLYGEAPRNITPYGQTVEDNLAPVLIERLAASSANALGHAAAALLSDRATPISHVIAGEAVRRMQSAWSTDQPERANVALAALLAGWAVDLTGIGLHHVLAQTVVRTAAVSHAGANAALLPWTLAAMARRRPGALEELDGDLEALARMLAERAGPSELGALALDHALLDRTVQTASERPELRRPVPAVQQAELRAIYEAAAAG